jgi:putative membrane-bound dehydrogenase-like protein
MPYRHLLSATLILIGVSGAGLVAAEFPTPYDSQKTDGNPLTPAAEAVAKFQLPPGFQATLFASEPQVRNPIAMTFDARGRLWVAENYTYAEAKKNFDTTLSDRIVIFHDDDGDGKSEKQVVFADTLKRLTSVELGFGGVYALCPPQLLFIPDANRDDVPDGELQVLLDGFDFGPIRHTIANGLKWGPDGWLYGRHGIQAVSKVGVPGAPDDQRVKINCAIWRFHPVTKVVEVVADGTTNSWGMDWDQHGEAFFINTVIGHLWHLIPGAHYRRMYGEDLDTKIYAPIEQHADHVHWATGEKWNDTKTGKQTGSTSAAGGGHAHIGLLIYQGGNWPAEYANKLFTINFHGTRLNQEVLERAGSGYVGRHAPDLLQTSDTWFRGVELISGPDGGVYVADWSDIGECHDHDGVHRSSGRIYKFTHGGGTKTALLPAHQALDVANWKWLFQANAWYSRQMLQHLQQRARANALVDKARTAVDVEVAESLAGMLDAGNARVQRLRALWGLQAMGALPESTLLNLLADGDEHLRVWAIRLLTDAMPIRGRSTAAVVESVPPSVRDALTALARKESSPFVRLALASALQRLPLGVRAALATPLLAHAEDAADHNLPLMYWYGVKDLATTHPAALATLATQTKIPQVRRFIARRLAEISPYVPALDELLVAATGQDMTIRVDVLAGMSDAFKGVRKAPKPSGWDALVESLQTNTDATVATQVRELHTVFGDGRALAETKRLALDATADLGQRRAALQTLIDSRPDDLRAVCEQLLEDRDLNALAARGLGQFDDPAIGTLLAKGYRRLFRQHARPDVLAVLVSRASFAKALLANVGDAQDQIPRADILPFHARAIRNFKDKDLNKQLTAVWGVVRDASEDKVQLIAALKQKLTPEILAKADQSQGRQVFTTLCSACHVLYGQGGKIGPDLTGSGRHDLSYILDNVVDPSAVVAADYRLAILTLKDGRVLSGLIPERAERTLTLQTMTDRQTIELSEITDTQLVNQSLMPEGLFQTLTDTQVRDLVAYLMGKQQVPLPGQ